MFETPILFIIFNRPDTTKQVFECIKAIKPKYLFIAADGPRSDRIDEIEKCNFVRKIVLDGIDWDCELKTLFREENQGCGLAVSSALNWFFENVEEGIILEDDCLPHPEFFLFCSEMLEFYRNNKKVMFIGGGNFQNGIYRGEGSYYFSAYSHVWGWASWSRVWKNYSFTLNEIDDITFKKKLSKYFTKITERKYWMDIFILMKKSAIDTWDYQLNFSVWKNNGVSIIPNVNLISNIGFGIDATHTTGNTKMANIPFSKILPIQHPLKIAINNKADRYFFKNHINHESLKIIIFSKIKKILKSKKSDDLN